MNANEIRESFLSFFERKGHKRVPSASLIPGGDQTLLFTNAGMVPFKSVFTGDESREYSRATSSQRCVRAGGKHNDLENVGRTARHHTFFEMLGNFSFGDYFKEEAILYAYELLVGEWKLDPDRMVYTVFAGGDGVSADEEARELWKKIASVGDDRVLGMGADENFWAMGDTGPCGPCSEIHYHLGDDLPCEEVNAGRICGGPSCECDRWMEIWNLVFMQYDRSESGTLKPLPKPSIDTGMGLERVAAILQGKESNYETDLLRNLIDRAAKLFDTTYGKDKSSDLSLRVTADHIRASAFLIGDGIYPSNEGRGYVLRRIMRRMIRHSRLLGATDPQLYKLVPVLREMMAEAHPILAEREHIITDAIRREEETFLETLDRGIDLLDKELRDLDRKEVSGTVVFTLYDTYGFPPDLTEIIAQERGFTIDDKGYREKMAEQRARSRQSSDFKSGREWDLRTAKPTEFVGYGSLSTEVVLMEIVENSGETYVVLDSTPFYAEAGGQAGDRGSLRKGATTIPVLDTIKTPAGVYLHKVESADGLSQGDRVEAIVDGDRRIKTERHHTATHILHAALFDILGDHIQQSGSYVGPDRLRFDFSHFSGVTREQLVAIEKRANDVVQENLPVSTNVYPIEEARKLGAKAFFGDKYGEHVRVVSIEGKLPYQVKSEPTVASREFCGGTHIRATGEIGLIKIVSESAVASGVRRLEAVTGDEAVRRIIEEESTLINLGALLSSTPSELSVKVQKLLDERKALEKELDRLRAGSAANEADTLIENAKLIDGVKTVRGFLPDLDRKALRAASDRILQKIGSGVVVLGSDPANDKGEKKAAFCVQISRDTTARIKAGDIVGRLAKMCDGGGGGRPEMAEAGGKSAEKVPDALDSVEKFVEELLSQQ